MKHTTWIIPGALLALAACGGPGGTGSTGAGGASGSSTHAASTGTGAASTSTTGPSSSSSTGSGGGAADIPSGTLIFEERFEDTAFAARGWYDAPSGALSTAEHAEGQSAFECAFDVGKTSCTGGKPARHKIPATETVYLGFHVKLSANWVGSGKPYHPHMFHFVSDADSDYVGPAYSTLTTYTEIVAGQAMLALQDSKNVDLACLLKNDDTFVGCNGDFKSYPFTESRSTCSCNGLVGDLDGRDCFPNGDGTWYSSRAWKSAGAFTDTAGPGYKGDWHFVEAYFAMNSVVNGVGVPDGKIRWVQDGKVLISHDKILLRTGAHAKLAFAQFAMLPYIGDGSPVAQQMWIDDLVVATGRP